jgi:MFS family permease
MMQFLSSALIFSQSFEAVMAVAVALGVAKGVRTVYMTIVIPSYVPIERLASASGIQMVVNGIFLMAFGPLIGEYMNVYYSCFKVDVHRYTQVYVHVYIVTKRFRTGCLERELQMVQLSATMCSCIAIL